MANNSEKTPKKPSARQRRKEERPSEIVDVATKVFLKNGYEATKLDDVARQSGIAKGTIYIYFPTKEDLFRAVVQQEVSANLQEMRSFASSFEGPFSELVPKLINQFLRNLSGCRGPQIAQLILREADRFPDLARVWYEDVATPMLSSFEMLIKKAQERKEIRGGDPRLMVFSLFGPITMGLLFSHLVGRLGYEPLDMERLGKQHAETILRGLLLKQKSEGSNN